MGRVHILEREQRVALPLERAFEFYGDARNLESITPPWMGFRLTSAPPQPMRGSRPGSRRTVSLGELAHRLFVRRDLRRIFDYRRDAVARLLVKDPALG